MQNHELKAILQGRVNDLLATQNMRISTNLETAINDLVDHVEDFVLLCKGEFPQNHAEKILKAISNSFEEVYLRSID